jgi:glycosyltransferase involved in cell wall biosynthesis
MMKALVVGSLAESLINFRGPLLAALQANDLQVHVAAPELQSGSSVRLQLESRGFIVHSIPLSRTGTNPVDDLRSLLSLLRLMRQIRPSLVLCYTIKPVIYGSLAARWSGVPHRFALITGLGYTFSVKSGQENRMRGWVRDLVIYLYKKALDGVQMVFFQNPDDSLLFRTQGILSKSVASLVVNGSGVDLSYFQNKPLPSGQPSFLLIARLLGDKGIREYAEAAKLVRTRYPYATFSLAGWIDENPDSISKRELDTWIDDELLIYRGHLADVRPAIGACSVYVLPSYREGTPRTVLEAMAMGRPIITTDAPGCRETVVDGHNGFLVPVKSVEALANAMLKFIETPDLVAVMGKHSRLIAEEKYDVHKVNSVMLEAMGVTSGPRR